MVDAVSMRARTPPRSPIRARATKCLLGDDPREKNVTSACVPTGTSKRYGRANKLIDLVSSSSIDGTVKNFTESFVLRSSFFPQDPLLRLGDQVVEVQGGKLLEEGGLTLEEPQSTGTRLSLTIQRHNPGRKRKWQQSLRSGAVNDTSNYEWPVVRWPVKNAAGLSIAASEAGGTLREQRIAAALRDIRLRHLDRRISLAVTARSADRRPRSNIRKRQHQRGRIKVDGTGRSFTGTGARLDGEGRRRRRPDTSVASGGDRPGGP